MKIKIATFGAILFITLCGTAGVSLADQGGNLSDNSETDDNFWGIKSTDFIKSRTYIGVGGISSVIDSSNDFNGTQSVSFAPVSYTNSNGVTGVTDSEVDLVPSINRNFGFNIMAGHREGPWAAELTYWRSDHTATFTGVTPTFTTSATLQSFDFNLKRYFLTQLPTQPFITVGMCFPWLWVSNGSNLVDANNNVAGINDETISGFGFDLGVGMEIYLDDHFSLVGGACQRWTEYAQINGAEKVENASLTEDGNSSDVSSLEGNGLNFYVDTTIGFNE